MLLIVLSSCSSVSKKEFIEPKQNSNSYGLVFSTEEIEVKEIRSYYKTYDYASISNMVNGYIRANNEHFIYKLISVDNRISLMVLSSLVAGENKVAFDKVFSITKDRGMPYSAESRIVTMKTAWDDCKQHFPAAMRTYFNNGAKLAPVQKHIELCDKMSAVFQEPTQQQ
jgi:hypothetical protein